MLKISKQTDYALVLLTVLAKLPHDTYGGLKDISEEHHLPYKFIGAIATKLRNASILESKEGSGGGYKLRKSPQKINLGEVVVALEGPYTPASRMDCANCRCRESCEHQHILANLIKALVHSMNNVTLADIVGNK